MVETAETNIPIQRPLEAGGWGRALGEVPVSSYLPVTSLGLVFLVSRPGQKVEPLSRVLPENPGLGEMLSYGVGLLPPGPDSGVGKTLKQKAPRCGSDLSALFSCVTEMQTWE